MVIVKTKIPGIVFTIKNSSISTQVGKPAENSNLSLDNTLYNHTCLVLGQYLLPGLQFIRFLDIKPHSNMLESPK